jgi:hypothetical protein
MKYSTQGNNEVFYTEMMQYSTQGNKEVFYSITQGNNEVFCGTSRSFCATRYLDEKETAQMMLLDPGLRHIFFALSPLTEFVDLASDFFAKAKDKTLVKNLDQVRLGQNLQLLQPGSFVAVLVFVSCETGLLILDHMCNITNMMRVATSDVVDRPVMLKARDKVREHERGRRDGFRGFPA